VQRAELVALSGWTGGMTPRIIATAADCAESRGRWPDAPKNPSRRSGHAALLFRQILC
jgi:hypothetical protein